MKLSIILNTFNNLEITKKYLPKMIQSCGILHDKETIINDNGSSKEMQDWLMDEFDAPGEIDIQLQPQNIGNPQGLNLNLSKAQGEYIAKIDPDFIMPDKWAVKAIELLETIPDIGIVGFYWARGLTHPELQKGIITKQLDTVYFEPVRVFGVWVFKRSLIDVVGPFCDVLGKYGVWDSEFQDRLKKNGLRNIYHREDCVHMGQDTEMERSKKNYEKHKSAEMLAGMNIGKHWNESKYYVSTDSI